MSGKLYFCATPIGNLGDITLRVLDVLRAADLVVAEDTRHTRKLLSHFDISKPLLSCHEHNEAERVDQILERVVAGETVAVVSDAGMPGISDPGAQLIEAAIARHIEWTVLPGPSAVLTGLILSGLPADQFVFLGFPPRRKQERILWLKNYLDLTFTLIFYEAPHRIAACLRDLEAVFGSRPAALVREISKRFEEVERGDLAELAALYATKEARGEFVLVVGGADEPSEKQISDADALLQVQQMIARGVGPSQAIKEVAAEHGLSRRVLYNSYHQLSGVDRGEGC